MSEDMHRLEERINRLLVAALGALRRGNIGAAQMLAEEALVSTRELRMLEKRERQDVLH
jgi:hypothetical protein